METTTVDGAYWDSLRLADELDRIAEQIGVRACTDAATLRAAGDLMRYVAHNVRVHKLERARTLAEMSGAADAI